MGPRALVKSLFRRAGTERDWVASRHARFDIAVFHEFHTPPYGGGNQFLLALLGELRRRGLAVETNRISGDTPACLYNSFNFDFHRLQRFARTGVRMVHRVDGPIGAYRGFDDGTDRRIVEINRLADVTIVQSRYSLDKHRELGLELHAPVLIPNTADPKIFHPPPVHPALGGRPLKVIATSWSANPRKGIDVLQWLDDNLDFDSVQITFAGNMPAAFRRIRTIGPLPSEPIAELLRAHDVFLAPSLDDPCSNSLIEGLASGLPAAFRRSGGHPELVGEGGIGFDRADELPDVFAQLRQELDERRAAIKVPALANVCDCYLDALRG
jgi:glycosyltransferase involved in cell wall biosynthesis